MIMLRDDVEVPYHHLTLVAHPFLAAVGYVYQGLKRAWQFAFDE